LTETEEKEDVPQKTRHTQQKRKKGQLRQFQEWTTTVNEHMSHLSKSVVMVLALWSFGMVVANSCGLTTVSVSLAALFDDKENTMRQRLREWYKERSAKKGAKRVELDVTTCFAPLVQWVLRWWADDEQRLALALDATTLGQRFTVLAVCIVYRGCAIPVAWAVVSATAKGSWKPQWLSLLTILQPSVPVDWFVIVLADRGLYARWLYEAIVQTGWHPFLRINPGGTYRRQAESGYRPLASVIPGIGHEWCGQVTCFKTTPLQCTLLACWTDGHKDAWLIVTDLVPNQAEVFWYGLRMWIECGFKQTKRAGWQWQATRMDDPARAARLWLAIAVATLWVVSVGGDAEDALPASSFAELPLNHVARRCRTTRRSRPRLVSCFRRGRLMILVALLTNQSIPKGKFVSEPWPVTPKLQWATPACLITPDIQGKDGQG
jgi:3-methyladenine DNA glycosylase AlkC